MQKFEPIRNDRINSAKTLSELFDLWRKEHENDEAFRQYEKRGVEKTSFECDGIINEETYNKQKSKVLFIAKEGNMGGRDTNAVVNKTDDSFWFRGVVEGKNKRNLFARRIIMLCNALSSGDYDNVDSRSLDAMSGAAFMNLNKRGGYRYCDWSVLEAYTIRFSEYIRREIELIEPDIIICCGRGVEYLLREHVFKDSCKIPKLIEVYHPSYFRISDKEYLRLFEIATNGESLEKPNALTENRQISVPAKAEASNNIRGIIFDTDAAYEPHATDEMLSPGAAVIMAFGSARKTLRYFNRGDYVYYYYKGVGIIAVA